MRRTMLIALCLAAVPAAATTRHVFVTSASGTGDLGSWSQAGTATGVAAGDKICQSLAGSGSGSGPHRAIHRGKP